MVRLLMLLVFALTLFVSATLLFLVQPMVGKMLLPYLGGTPAVWNTCMVFFQALLLAGYAYAHLTSTWLGVRRQAIVHLFVLPIPLLTLPIVLDKNLVPQGQGNPIFGVLLVLMVAAGLPFLVVSTSAPLLQKWFAETGHPAAHDPYFLYGASNLGSMLALVAYPALVEPAWKLVDQSRLWMYGYGLLALMTAVCAGILWFSSGPSSVPASGNSSRKTDLLSPPPSLWTRLHWVLLAFVPSSLMLGANTYITTDVAAIPLLWILPLGLYLLSFILVFSRLPVNVHLVCRIVLPIAVLGLGFVEVTDVGNQNIVIEILAHLLTLFLAAMVCHGELANNRPSTHYLTGYYLLMSLGGVLGGLFNTLVAPLIFNMITEYPLMLALACLLMPTLGTRQRHEIETTLNYVFLVFLVAVGSGLVGLLIHYDEFTFRLFTEPSRWKHSLVLAAGFGAAMLYAIFGRGSAQDRWLDFLIPCGILLVCVGQIWGFWNWISGTAWASRLDFNREAYLQAIIRVLVFGVPASLCLICIRRPIQFALAAGAVLFVGGIYDNSTQNHLHLERSFYGTLAVINREEIGEHYLRHGNINHGVQMYDLPARVRAEIFVPFVGGPTDAVWQTAARYQHWIGERAKLRQKPVAYFHPESPIGQLFESFNGARARKNIAILGLGSGGLSAYAQAGQKLTFFELDPAVERIAKNPAYFTYLEDTKRRGVDLKILFGDGRLQMEKVEFARPEDAYDLIIFDAFSSDAIPVHLVTYDALKLYLSKLAPHGVVVFHISNRYVELEPVVARLRDEAGLVGLIQHDDPDTSINKYATTQVILARSWADFGDLGQDPRWNRDPLEVEDRYKKLRVWTDDFSNLMSVFKW